MTIAISDLKRHGKQLRNNHWLQDGQVALPADAGESHVSQAGRYRRTVQPQCKMFQILALRFADGSVVGRSTWKGSDIALSIDVMRHRINESALVVWKLD